MATSPTSPTSPAASPAASGAAPASAASSAASAATPPPFDPAPGTAKHQNLPYQQLSPEDQAELRLFRDKMNEYDAAVQQCTKEKQDARAEADRLAKDIKDEEANLQADAKSLKKDHKTITPEELQKRKDELQKLEKDIKEKKAKKSSLEKKAKLNCKIKPPNYCVPVTESSKILAPLGDIPKLINDANDTKIDFGSLLSQEGAYGAAYVPWWPIPAGKKTYTTTPDNLSTDAPDNSEVVEGAPLIGTHSGVTIGMGIDFGGQRKKVYYEELDATNRKYNIMSQEEVDNLKNKIDPYMGKKRARACQYLRNHPLELNDKELKLLHLRAIQVALDAASKKSGFAEDQTGVFLRTYKGKR